MRNMRSLAKIKEIYENAKTAIKDKGLSLFHKKGLMKETGTKKNKKLSKKEVEAMLVQIGKEIEQARAKEEADFFSRLPKGHQATTEIKSALENYCGYAKGLLMIEFDNLDKKEISAQLDEQLRKELDRGELINLHLKALIFQEPGIIQAIGNKKNEKIINQIIDVVVEFCDFASTYISDKPKRMHDYLIEKNKREITRLILEIINNEDFYKVAGELNSSSDAKLWYRTKLIIHHLTDKDAKKSLLFLKKLAEMDTESMKEAIRSEYEIDRQIFHEKIYDSATEAITLPLESAKNIIKIYNFNKKIKDINKENPDGGKTKKE